MSASSKVDAGRLRVRELARQYLSGKPESLEAVRELLDYLLRLTVVASPARLKFLDVQDSSMRKRAIGIPGQPLPLTDGRFLRVLVSLSLEDDPDKGPRLRVYRASYRYQESVTGKHDWIFRYDYVREPKDHHPSSHLQIRGSLTQYGILPPGTALERIHFPTGRMTIGAVIRLLIEQFHVRCNSGSDVWRPILAESEREFERIAHRHLSGPDR